MTKTDRILLILTTAALLVSAVLTLWPAPAPEVAPAFHGLSAPEQTLGEADSLWLDMGRSIDVNHATAKELEALPGIGATLAKRIVAYRAAHGPFRRIEELMMVDGIHESTLEEILAVATVRK